MLQLPDERPYRNIITKNLCVFATKTGHFTIRFLNRQIYRIFSPSRADASVVDRSSPLGHLKMDIAAAHHRRRLVVPAPVRIQPLFNSTLAIAEDFGVSSLHSKCFLFFLGLDCSNPSEASI